ncbi:MAG: ArnT family glycosyltransferase [Solirubrobacterales bacterium]
MAEQPSLWLRVGVIAVLVACVYWFIDTRSTLWDRDEPRFARATVEMVESGNYLYPTFNGNLRPDKPILIYWLMSVPVRLLGPTSLACRFFAGVGVAVACVLTFLLARRFLGAAAGLWSMVVLASTGLVMMIGTAATSDGILLPCMVGVMVVFAKDMASGLRWRDVAVMGLALGLGLLAKGPVALLPIPVILVALWLNRRSEMTVRAPLGHLGVAMAAGVLLFLAWAIPANNATAGEFLRMGIGHHVLARSAKPLEHHGGSFLLNLPYYLPVVVAGFFPWSLHLPGAISAVLGRRVGQGRFRELFLAWTITIMVIMTLVATKLPHYILFIWPALSLAVGGTLAAASQGVLADRDLRWLRGGVYFFGPVAGGAVLAFLAAPFLLHTTSSIVAFWTAAAILLVASIRAIRQQLRNQFQASAVTLLGGMILLLLPLMLGGMPVIERWKISPALAEAVRRETSHDVPVATFKYGEPTLNFYVGRKIEPLAGEAAVVEWARQPQPGVLVVPKDVLTALADRDGPFPLLQEIASQKGLNYSKGKLLEVVAVQRMADSSR